MRKKYKHSLSSLNEQKACDLYASGMSSPEIGKVFNVTGATIRNIVRRSGGIIHSARFTNTRECNHRAFSTITDESSYWLGFMLADGCVYSKGSLKLALHRKDVESIKRFIDFMEVDTSPNVYGDMAEVCITSRWVVKDLIRFDVTPNKTHTATVHPSLESNRHFWRGVIDGDGGMWVDDRGVPFINLSGTYAIVDSFRDFVVTSFPHYRGQVYPHASIYQLHIRGRIGLEVMKMIYQESDKSISMQRKYNQARSIISDLDSSYGIRRAA